MKYRSWLGRGHPMPSPSTPSASTLPHLYLCFCAPTLPTQYYT